MGRATWAQSMNHYYILTNSWMAGREVILKLCLDVVILSFFCIMCKMSKKEPASVDDRMSAKENKNELKAVWVWIKT